MLSKPWETVGTDLYQFKQSKYVVVVDYYSRYIETMLIRDERSITVINIKSIFARHGIPENVISDNGREYTSDEFKEFSRKYQFKHITFSPKYPRGNSVAERSIQTLKNIMEKSNDPYLGLLSHRTTPLSFGISPGELLMNRKLSTTLPDFQQYQILTKEKHELYRKQMEKRKIDEKIYHNNKFSKQKKFIDEGDNVYIKDLDRMSTLLKISNDNDRTYIVETDRSIVRRNIIELIPVEKEVVITRSGREVRPPDRLIEC